MCPIRNLSIFSYHSSSKKTSVASRPRFGGDSQAFSWYRPAGKVQLGRDQLERLSWIETSWKGSAGQGPARPKGSSYVYKYQGVTQVDSKQ